jgi:hypothetical protein
MKRLNGRSSNPSSSRRHLTEKLTSPRGTTLTHRRALKRHYTRRCRFSFMAIKHRVLGGSEKLPDVPRHASTLAGMQCTSVPCERMFSRARLASPNDRARQLTSSLEARVVGDNWTKNAMRVVLQEDSTLRTTFIRFSGKSVKWATDVDAQAGGEPSNEPFETSNPPDRQNASTPKRTRTP